MIISARSRFAGLAGARPQSCSLADTVVFSTERHVVVPTVGSILPFWLIVLPRYHTLNYAEQPAETRTELPTIVTALQASLRVEHGPIVFEHGPTHIGTDVGCGCDHAHIHLLWVERALAASIFARFEEGLSATPSKTSFDGVYDGIDPEQPYYLAWSSGRRLLEQPATRTISQFFRRLVAESVGYPNHWDYRAYPFLANVQKTLRQFGCLNQAA